MERDITTESLSTGDSKPVPFVIRPSKYWNSKLDDYLSNLNLTFSETEIVNLPSTPSQNTTSKIPELPTKNLSDFSMLNSLMNHLFFPTILFISFVSFYVIFTYLKGSSSVARTFSKYVDCMTTIIAIQFTFAFFAGVIISELSSFMILVFLALIIFDQFMFVGGILQVPKKSNILAFIFSIVYGSVILSYIIVTILYLVFSFIPYWLVVTTALSCILFKGIVVIILAGNYHEENSGEKADDEETPEAATLINQHY